MAKIERALLSVSNKEGVVELARALRVQGVELVSSGGTAALLKQHDIPVIAVSDYTGSPEILDGRVKTLHPKIFAGILARATDAHQRQLAQHDMGRIDLVVVNLYPFEQTIANPSVTLEQAIEQIDIGGPSLVRAAAKNHERVAVVVDPGDYGAVISELEANGGEIGAALRRRLTARAFAYTAAYDAAISNYLQHQVAPNEPWPHVYSVQLKQVQGLRYGENPHQSGAFYAIAGASEAEPRPAFEQLHGKELSYNNIVDVDAAWALAKELPHKAVCVIKHTNPCGAACIRDGELAEAFERALATDPVSAFGGIVSCNRPVDRALAEQIRELFLEAVVAPDFAADALEVLAKKKKLRLVRGRDDAETPQVWRSALGGLLLQQQDHSIEQLAACQVPTQAKPSAQQLDDLQFAWIVCKHVKSNAIVFAKDGQLVGVGAGQMSRVDSVRLAATKANLPLKGTVVASDAFFPFRDGLDEAAKAGAVAVVQPGGSVRDEEVIAAANEHGMPMVFAGVRHFRH